MRHVSTFNILSSRIDEILFDRFVCVCVLRVDYRKGHRVVVRAQSWLRCIKAQHLGNCEQIEWSLTRFAGSSVQFSLSDLFNWFLQLLSDGGLLAGRVSFLAYLLW